ncbi:MAG: DegT/DnrJ/EryC1/StrS family aminotransferase [Candidatus Omnitrophica bacterium]|nr:DegT/DnrJ/EryC1/StrS family aminotransferase [Candidatus Omnitrophota bacterium]MBU4478935.1 DegT/DnrJ/EryC1/StrS family aminotransferase [Candidatus Omnitrophota bacterium]MCG2704393.1 DegT/DnrJ/EryC1/StrS family aminotransferase [Candidatus Omnitrophota bacterium]
MNVSFIDVRSQNIDLKQKILKRLEMVVESSEFILGEEVRCFESEFAAYCGSAYAVGMNSGTDALFLSLLSLGVGPGDEVICPVYTYIATALSISYTGAKPVFVDIDARTFTLNVEDMKRKITHKTKAVIPVHLYGHPAAMREIIILAKRHGLAVVEDAAQAHGAMLQHGNGRWQKLGTLGDIGCFSFYPTKNLGACGDAGITVTNNKRLHKKLLMFRDQGRKGSNRYMHYLKGYNARLDSFQAAVLREKLKFLDEWNGIRQKSAAEYARLLQDTAGVVIPYEHQGTRHVYHLYAVLIRKRDDVCALLRRKDIYTGIVYHRPLHLQPAYKELKRKRGDFPIAEKVAREILCLPMHPSLTKEQVAYVVQGLKDVLRDIANRKGETDGTEADNCVSNQ